MDIVNGLIIWIVVAIVVVILWMRFQNSVGRIPDDEE